VAAPPMGPNDSLTLRIKPTVLLHSKIANRPSMVALPWGDTENILIPLTPGTTPRNATGLRATSGGQPKGLIGML